MKKIVLLLKIEKIYGGAERRLARVLNALEKMPELECAIYFTGINAEVENFLHVENLHHIKYMYFESEYKCAKAVEKGDFDTVWFFNINHIGLLLVLLQHKYRVVMTIANVHLSRFKFKHWRQRLAFHYLCKKVDIIDCLYPAALSEFNKRNYNNVKITPCPFINLSDFVPEKKEKNIILASRLIPEKNIEMAIEAIKNSEEDIRKSEFHVFIYGEGVLKEEILYKLEAYNMQEYVSLCGYADLREVLPYSKIFLSLSEITNYPSQVLLESISSGNYIVTVEDEDIKKIVKESFCCFVDRSIEGISEGIKRAITMTSSENAEYIVKQARNFAIENFNINNSINYFKEILCE